MRILIVEEEMSTKSLVLELTQEILKDKITSINITKSIDEAADFIISNQIDLCLLDLNLKGSGFDIYKSILSNNFHTIIISESADLAIEAFKYGVLDFVPKPIKKNRLSDALNRFVGLINKCKSNKAQFIVCRKRNLNTLINVDDILYFKANSYLIEVYLKNGNKEIIDKPLNKLIQILPDYFSMIHRSYLINTNFITSYKHIKGSTYSVNIINGESLPLSISNYKKLKERNVL